MARDKDQSFLKALGVAALCMVPAVLFSIITGLGFPMVPDEVHYHLKTVTQFTYQFPLPDISWYPSASGPLPFYLISLWTKLWGLSLPVARSLSLIASFFALVMFDCTRRRLFPSGSFPTTFILSFTAYFVMAAVCILSINYVLLAEISLMALVIIWLRNPRPLTMLGIALLLAVIAWSRVVSLVLAIPLLWVVWRTRIGMWQKVTSTVLITLALCSFLPLYLLWHGFSPPAFSGSYQANLINPAQLTLSLCMLGLYLAPVAVSGIRRWGGMWGYGLFGGVIALLFPLNPEGNYGPAVRVLGLLQDISPACKTIGEFVLGCLGMWVVLGLWGSNRETRFLLGAFFAFALGLIIAPNAWEHLHYVIWAPILLLLAGERWVQNWQRWGSLLITAAFGIAVYYQLFTGT
jgi:hypothetical protein